MRKPLVLFLVVLMSVPVGTQALPLLSDPPTATQPASLFGPDVEATVIRDQWGIPHIYADDPYSLFFANGYVQAEDRFAAMDILRHVSEGRLGELTGPSGLEMDLVTRRELYTHAERVDALEALPQRWQDAFAAFADGVNAWLLEARTDPTKLPVEYPALAEAPEDWNATSTIAVAQYLLDVFGRGSGGQEVQNAKLLAHLVDTLGLTDGVAAFDDLVWGINDDTYTTIKAGDDPTPFVPLPAEVPHDLSDPQAIPADQVEASNAAVAAHDVDDATMPIHETMAGLGWPFKFGSNAQLLDARFSENGKPLLYGGPQMGYFTPAVPYEVGLHGAGFDAVGMGVTGAPGVIIGRTANASFTITSGASDQVDMVVEKLTGPYSYLVDGVEHEMDCRTETHVVRPGPADMIPAQDPNWRPPLPDVVTQEVCRTIHGPVLARSADGQYAFASERSYRNHEAQSGVLWLQIGTVRNVTEFQDLFETFRFTFNFNYADDDGNILYMHVGAQPIRDDRLDPRLPRPGWDSSYDWKGILTGRDLPSVLNPASGYTVNWNNQPTPGWASGDARELWGEIHRAELMEETLLAKIDEKGKLTLDDLRAINEYAATHEPYADDLFPYMRAAAVEVAPQVVPELDAWAASGFDYADRDGDGFHDHKAFRLYELWAENMIHLVFRDELGDFTKMPHWEPSTGGDPHAADHGDHTNKFNVLLDTLYGEAGYDWCQVQGGSKVGNVTWCQMVTGWALEDAVHEGDWQEPLPQRKSKFTALGAGPSYEIPMTNRPTFQHFYDWGVPEGEERSRNALAPGQKSNMNSAEFALFSAGAYTPPHLEDQLQMYVDFGDKPLLFARDAVERHEESRIEFG